jgi:hypothetical protein
MRLQGGTNPQRTAKVQVTARSPQKTANGASLTKVSRGTEMRPNKILQQKTKSLKVNSPALSTRQINQIKASPKGFLPKFLAPGKASRSFKLGK